MKSFSHNKKLNLIVMALVLSLAQTQSVVAGGIMSRLSPHEEAKTPPPSLTVTPTSLLVDASTEEEKGKEEDDGAGPEEERDHDHTTTKDALDDSNSGLTNDYVSVEDALQAWQELQNTTISLIKLSAEEQLLLQRKIQLMFQEKLKKLLQAEKVLREQLSQKEGPENMAAKELLRHLLADKEILLAEIDRQEREGFSQEVKDGEEDQKQEKKPPSFWDHCSIL